MAPKKQIQTALLSVFHKEGIVGLAGSLHKQGVKLYSTGGTQKVLEEAGLPVTAVETLTGYPSILGGRVKTLHPAVFGGILARRGQTSDKGTLEQYSLPAIDMVVVDLYPFEQTLKDGGQHEDIIEKIDIGGISLIRAAAKNYQDVLVVCGRQQYADVQTLLEENNAQTSLELRKTYAAEAFAQSAHYDTAIFNYFDQDVNTGHWRASYTEEKPLRYGENPHQQARFLGNFEELFTQLHGKAISYNNLLDIDAAVRLMADFRETTFAILKHNNACGVASRERLADAWEKALEGDPVSAFGGILITNATVDAATATEIDKLFFEVIIAPGYAEEALPILQKKKNRIILVQKAQPPVVKQHRTVLNGALVQEEDALTETPNDLRTVTQKAPGDKEVDDLLFGNIIVKHSKSNAIVLAKNKQLLASGVGQTSRVDALKQAIGKARHFNLKPEGGILASDAFFPFADSVELANQAGITSVIQPGGSKRDADSIDYCNAHNMSMVFTGNRHFKH